MTTCACCFWLPCWTANDEQVIKLSEKNCIPSQPPKNAAQVLHTFQRTERLYPSQVRARTSFILMHFDFSLCSSHYGGSNLRPNGVGQQLMKFINPCTRAKEDNRTASHKIYVNQIHRMLNWIQLSSHTCCTLVSIPANCSIDGCKTSMRSFLNVESQCARWPYKLRSLICGGSLKSGDKTSIGYPKRSSIWWSKFASSYHIVHPPLVTNLRFEQPFPRCLHVWYHTFSWYPSAATKEIARPRHSLRPTRPIRWM